MVKAVFLDVGNTLMHLTPSFAGAFANVAIDHGFGITQEDIAAVLPRVDAFIDRRALERDDYSTSPERSHDFWITVNTMIFSLCGIGDGKEGVVDDMAREMERRFNSGKISVAFDDALGVISDLKQRGYIVATLSNGTTGMATCINALDFAPYLDFCLVSAIVGWEKPGTRIFEIALEKAGVEPEEAIHIGDGLVTDVMGARNAGITPILIDRGRTKRSADVPCEIIHSLDEIYRFLDE